MANKIQAALELRKALQFFLENLDPETQAEKILSVPSLYPLYEIGKAYKIKDVFRYGENVVGDAQLYQVLQDHTSSAEWAPDISVSLYKKIGVSSDGTPEWVQPLGASDAYNTGDVVMFEGFKYESLIDANVWSPSTYPTGWKKV